MGFSFLPIYPFPRQVMRGGPESRGSQSCGLKISDRDAKFFQKTAKARSSLWKAR
jgi:hypothetical protein